MRSCWHWSCLSRREGLERPLPDGVVILILQRKALARGAELSRCCISEVPLQLAIPLASKTQRLLEGVLPLIQGLLLEFQLLQRLLQASLLYCIIETSASHYSCCTR
jgi:hypothetical protein